MGINTMSTEQAAEAVPTPAPTPVQQERQIATDAVGIFYRDSYEAQLRIGLMQAERENNLHEIIRLQKQQIADLHKQLMDTKQRQSGN